MKYQVFERLTLVVGALAVLGTVVAGIAREPIIEELIGQLLLLVVLVGAVHWGRNGGFAAAVLASLIYLLLRVPLFIAEGLTSYVIELVLIRTLSFGVIGILGGELCTRVKYIFASMEDANSLDHITRVFNERFVGCRLRKAVGEHERYGSDISMIALTLDPGLYLSLRKLRQRQILRSVATHVRNDVRLVDDVGRLNDSRFLIVLPHTPREGAEIAAERVRSGVRDLLGARDESITVEILGTPTDLDALKDFVGTLDLRDPDMSCRQLETPAPEDGSSGDPRAL